MVANMAMGGQIKVFFDLVSCLFKAYSKLNRLAFTCDNG